VSKGSYALVGIVAGTLLGCAARDPITLPELGTPCTSEMIGGVACGSMQFPVRAHVVFEGSDRPNDGYATVEILSGFYADGKWIGPLHPIEATVSTSGDFSFEAGASHSTRYVCRDGQWRTESEVLDTHLLFRAPGCQDAVIVVRPEANELVVTMQCSLEVGQLANTDLNLTVTPLACARVAPAG